MIKLTIEEMHRLDIASYRLVEKRPIVVVLDNVRSQYNVGAIFRTCDAFRIRSIYLCGICCCPPDKEIHKTALGAELSMDWSYFKSTDEAIRQLKEENYAIWGIEQAHNSLSLRDIEEMGSMPSSVAIVFGHEVFGIQESVLSLCDSIIEIPQYGTKHSLNVSVSAGIALYAISSQYDIDK